MGFWMGLDGFGFSYWKVEVSGQADMFTILVWLNHSGHIGRLTVLKACNFEA